jgi:phage gp29-like protein
MTLPDFPYYIPFGKTKGEILPREKFIFHANRATGLGALRGGLYRGLSWYSLFTNYTIKDWMSFMDIYGIPLRLGKFKPTADDSSRRILKEAVRNLGADAAAVISEDTTIEFIESNLSGSHNLFESAVEFFNRQKSKRVLGQTLTTEQGKSGSYSLGNVHDRVRFDILQFDCAMLDETLTRDLIVPLVKANFGEQKRYPRFVTDIDDRESKTSRLERLDRLYKMGLALPVAQLYEAAGIARPTESDEVVKLGKGGV